MPASAEPPEPMTAPPRADLIVQDFKCLRGERRFECRGLTVLAGANCSGKSSAFQPLWLLKQTQQATYDPPGALKLDGDLVEFSNASEFLWRGAAEGEFGIGLRTWYPGHASADSPWDSGDAETVSRLLVGNGELTVERCEVRQYKHGKAAREDILDRAGDADAVQRFLRRPLISEVSNLRTLIDSPHMGGQPVDSVDNRRFTLLAVRQWPSGTMVDDPWTPRSYACLESAVHIPGLRGKPERRFPLAAATNKPSGPFDRAYTAGFLLSWQKAEDDRLGAVGAQLAAMGLTGGLRVSDVDGVSASILVNRLADAAGADLVNIADTGVGVSQVLPILVALLAAGPGQIVHIEQPELHLHPEAQARLAAVLIEAAKRGVLVVIETHSPLLLLALQTLLADGELPPERTRLYWFERGPEGEAKVTEGQLDEHGRYLKWPVDFWEVERRRHLEYVGKSLGMSTEA
jgi:hypothetical protein